MIVNTVVVRRTTTATATVTVTVPDTLIEIVTKIMITTVILTRIVIV